jgi:orotidine-5'-phosphate decarboxylase
VKDIPLNERIIFALDFSDPVVAQRWVERLDPYIKFFKIGLQLFLAGGWTTVEYILQRGNKVMLDLKFFDIPQTVRLAVQQLRDRGITFATIHGNEPIIKAAVSERAGLKILAVTLLTSFDESDMRAMGMSCSTEDLVLLRSQQAIGLGCDGIICSALDVPAIRRELGNNFFIVSPGIRPATNCGIEHDDQRRIATARQAIINGTDYLVIGRPISRSPDPVSTVQGIQKEITDALAEI